MRFAGPEREAANPWADIARPARPSRVAGVAMAGFRGRGTDVVDYLAVPTPALMMAVDFGDGRLVVEDTAGREQHGSLATGLAPGAVRVRARGIACVQVRLSPLAARAVLGIPAAGLSHTVIGLEDLWGPDAARVEDQLHEATSWRDRFEILDAALGQRHDAEPPPVAPEIAFAWRRIVTSRGLIRVGRLADEVGWSRKRLWSRFRSQVGLTPKSAARLVRFDRAAHQLAAGASPATVAAESGYADQSHLHREVREFAEMTPTVVAGQPWLAVDHLAWPTARARSAASWSGPR